jgi:hypothetical protein
MQKLEHLLQVEVEFWRRMIKSRRGTVPAQALERMTHALELAQKKLLMIREELPFTGTTQ